jgi:D-alanyl-D-alanine carboxypeptidase
MNNETALSLPLVRLLAACLLATCLLAACQAITPPPPTAAPAAVEPLDPELGKKLQAALDAAVASPDSNWPGAIVHVEAPGLGTWDGATGLADVAANTAMQPQDRFRAGSLMKPLIATVILQLVEEGRLALDDRISTLLPEQVAHKFANSDQITLRMLLNHTSGLPDFMEQAKPAIVAQLDKVWDAEAFLDLAAAEPPLFAPGASERYSNTNYLLLGLIIEKVTGQPWRQEIVRRIFEPLGLQDTFLPAPEETSIPGAHAHGYADFGSGIIDATDATNASVVGAAGGQSLVTTAPDLARFLDALLAGRLFRKSETLAAMLDFGKIAADQFPPGDPLGKILIGYGLGLMEASYGSGLTAIGHSGDTPGGYHAFVFRFPDKAITISGVVNAPDPSAGFLELMPRVLKVLAPGYTPAAQPAAPASDAGAALQGLLDGQVKAQGILGMAMAVRLPDGTMLWRESGSTDPAKKNRWTLDTMSALGSVTKTFTAVVIMQLVEEGKLSLDEPINTWFPDQPNGDKITVRMLLSHTSGLANFISPQNERDPKWSQAWAPQDLVAEANRRGPVDEPGTKVAHYANTNYFLLGLIVEAVTGNSWIHEVRTRIIEPLGLAHTTFMSEEGVWGETLMPGYTKTADGYMSVLDVPALPHPSTAWAAGGVVSTLGDLMTFAGALFDGRLVSQKSLAEMATPLGKDAETGRLWGLGGATVEGVPGAFGMGGDVPGYHAFFVGVAGTKLVVAALVNTEEGDVITPGLTAFQYLSALPPAR